MTTTPSNPPAFPRPASVDPTSGSLTDGDRVVPGHDGMTLRDWFAGQFLAGFSTAAQSLSHPVPTPGDVARIAYVFADEMLAAREMK